MRLHWLFLLFLIVACNNQEQKAPSNNQVETTFYDHGKPRSKSYFLDDTKVIKEVFYTDGALRNRYQIINNLIEGEYYFYYPNGRIYSITRFRQGLKEGWLQKYRENGEMMSKQYFHNDQPGRLIEYNKEGEERLQPRLLFENAQELPEGFKYGYRFYMSAPVKKVEFYFGILQNDEFFHDDLVPMSNGTFYDDSLGEVKMKVENDAGLLFFNKISGNSPVSSSFNLVAKSETSVSNIHLSQTAVNILFD